MGAFQQCDTCTEAPATTPHIEEQVDGSHVVRETTEQQEQESELAGEVPAMAAPEEDARLPDNAPLVQPADPMDRSTEAPTAFTPIAQEDKAEINQTEPTTLPPLPISPSATAIAAVASAVANEAAAQVKKALESTADPSTLLTGVSVSTKHLKKPFTLTWVMYDVDDPLGQLLALVTLSPVFIMVMYATLILFQRDLHIIFMVLGQLLNEVLNQILKRTIDQKRPDGADMEDAGMPSAHSQFMAFFATYVVLYTSNRMSKRREWEHKAAIVGVILLACLVFVSRIRLGYHSVAQVVVGAVVGAGAGIFWYIFMEHTAFPLFSTIASWDICQYFFIRDCTHIEDMVQFQYEAIQKKIQRKHHGL